MTSSANVGLKIDFANFLAGGLSAVVSSTLTNPLEVVKTQLQSSSANRKHTPLLIVKEILRREGMSGFFRGLTPLLIGIMPTKALFFWSYTAAKGGLERTFLQQSPIVHLLSALLAGFVTNTVRFCYLLIPLSY
jgi:solute carrier family 25, member 33/36